MHIGLFGGIGPAATDFYYRRLISAFATRKVQLELTIVHAHTPTYLTNVANKRTADQVASYTMLAKRLAAAGAECVAISSVAGHFCIGEFNMMSPIPVVDMIPEVNRTIEQRGYKRVGVLGTRAAMETRLLGGVTTAEIVPPTGKDLEDVHNAYVEMATTGIVTATQCVVFNRVCQRLLNEGHAEAIMLGGTDLVLAFSEETAAFPLIDCAAIHVDAIATLAVS